jgi:hypothetical protein
MSAMPTMSEACSAHSVTIRRIGAPPRSTISKQASGCRAR